ncbi:MAG: hypothetical protein AB1499_07480 [Nitrospirota bacterium]
MRITIKRNGPLMINYVSGRNVLGDSGKVFFYKIIFLIKFFFRGNNLFAEKIHGSGYHKRFDTGRADLPDLCIVKVNTGLQAETLIRQHTKS